MWNCQLLNRAPSLSQYCYSNNCRFRICKYSSKKQTNSTYSGSRMCHIILRNNKNWNTPSTHTLTNCISLYIFFVLCFFFFINTPTNERALGQSRAVRASELIFVYLRVSKPIRTNPPKYIASPLLVLVPCCFSCVPLSVSCFFGFSSINHSAIPQSIRNSVTIGHRVQC